MIYFIKTEKFDLVKIGHTNDIKSRIKELQVASPFKLKCIKLISILDRQGESFLHRVFNTKRQSGEWFVYDSSVKNFINNLHEKAEYKIDEIKDFLKNCQIPIPEDTLKIEILKERIKPPGMRVNTEKILFELTKLDWTACELAKKTGMTRAGISILLQRETAPINTLNKIGNALNLDPRDLLI